MSSRFTSRFRPTYRGFCRFTRALGVDLAPFQRTIARASFGEREIVAVLPRGSAKSTTAALLAVHHVVSHSRPSVYVGAGSREQARVIGRMVERFARDPAIGRELIVRHDELRRGAETALLIVASDGGKAHGWERPTLMIGDEVWSWKDREPTLLGAMQTALIKNREAKLLLISTSAASLDTPLGRMRVRALAQPEIVHQGGMLDAHGDGLRWLEWSLPEDADPEDMRAVKRANPAPWISVGDLREQHARVTPIEWLQFHCCRWGVGEGQWLPPGAWAACRGEPKAEQDTPVYLGVDIGGSRASSCVIGVTEDLEVVECHVFNGDEAVLRVTETVIEIAARRPVAEMSFDPWRYEAEALRLQRDHGLSVLTFPQSQARMTAASENLHRVIVEGELNHPGDPQLDRQVAAAVARATGRGWRLDKAARDSQIDAVVALAMAVERAGYVEPESELVGWL